MPMRFSGPVAAPITDVMAIEQTPPCANVRTLLCTFLLFIVLLMGAVIVLTIKVSKEQENRPEIKYREFFKTDLELEEFKTLIYNTSFEPDFTPGTYVNSSQQQSCSFSCANNSTTPMPKPSTTTGPGIGFPANSTPTPAYPTNRSFEEFANLIPRKKRDVSVMEPYVERHSCCVSTIRIIKPSSSVDLYHNHVDILQLPKLGQYFVSQKCRQAHDCTGCGCHNGVGFHQAVVSYPDQPDYLFITTIQLRGCCKCYNNLPPPP